MSRVFGPLTADDYLVTEGKVCSVCNKPFEVGHYLTLKAVAPADEEEREKMLAGRPYNAEAAPVHVDCPNPSAAQ